MITLTTIMALYFIISTYRLYKHAKKTNESFTPFALSFIDAVGFIFGLVFLLLSFIYFSVNYLP